MAILKMLKKLISILGIKEVAKIFKKQIRQKRTNYSPKIINSFKEVLIETQIELLPLVKEFSKDFGLVGETAIALYLEHRRSIDFDLFTNQEFENLKIRKKITKFSKTEQVIVDESDQFTIVIKGVRFTFLNYPFKINFVKNFDSIIKLPELLTLVAMKAYALGGVLNGRIMSIFIL